MSEKQTILFKYVSGNLSDEERKAFESELSSSEELQKLYNDYQTVWNMTDKLNYDSSHTDMALSSFQQIVKAPIRILGFDWLKMAASILILAAFSVGIYYFSSNTDTEFTSTNTVVSQTLEDNSEIKLNVNSSVVLDADYGETTREMWLTGEALFSVTKSDLPFIVHTPAGAIEVLGTEFKVFTQNNKTVVELFSGSVKYKNNQTQQEEILTPGDQLLHAFGTVEVNKVNALNELSSSIECSDMPLYYILGQLKLHYNVDYNLKDKFLKERYTVTLPVDNLNVCLETLSRISDRNFAIKNNVIILK
jgi:transmembrane sensor